MTISRHVLFMSALGMVFACAGCASDRPSRGVMVPVASTVDGASRVSLLAVTTRRRSTDAGEMFNGERAPLPSYASIDVSIPPDSGRTIGQVQWPSSVPGDPRVNFVTTSANHIDRAAFNAAVSSSAKSEAAGKVLVFVHGFNNRFDDAVYRFAQIIHDARAQGTPVLFTWPSRGQIGLSAYAYDRESANFSRDALEQLIESLERNPNVKEINLLAHSMGNWVTLEALRGRSIRAGKIGNKIKNVFLVAPDVDVDVFRTQIGRVGFPRPRVVLFVSQDDSALNVSRLIWGGEQRLGNVNPDAEPYRSTFEQEKITVFDLTQLKGNAHSRAFDDITEVMVMVREQLNEEPVVTSGRRIAGARTQ
jgi:esterase/lipase superfamily enzyme